MAQMHQRIIAFALAILFFVTASATAVYVIYDTTQQNKTNNSTADASDPTKQTDTSFCSQANTDGTTNQEKLAAPEAFKPAGKTDSLQVKDLTPGTGEAAANGQCLYMKYYGTLASDGTMFDENFTKDTAFKFELGAGAVIKGWDQGLVGMKVGGTRQLVIPSALAYGDQAQGKIPANADLVFVVKLLKIEKPKN